MRNAASSTWSYDSLPQGMEMKMRDDGCLQDGGSNSDTNFIMFTHISSNFIRINSTEYCYALLIALGQIILPNVCFRYNKLWL